MCERKLVNADEQSIIAEAMLQRRKLMKRAGIEE